MQKNKINDIILYKIKYREGQYIENKNIDFVDALICAKCKFQNYEKLSFDKDLSKC